MLNRILPAAILLGLLAKASANHLEKCVCYDPVTETNCNDGSFEDQCEDYIKDVALLVWPSLLGMVLFVLILPLASIFICLCKCCRYEPGNAPPTWHRKVFFTVLCVCLVAGGVCTGFAIRNSESLSDGVDGMNDLVDDLVRDMRTDTTNVSNIYQDLNGRYPLYATTENRYRLESVARNVSRQAKDIEDAEDDILKWDHGSGKVNSRRGLTIAFCALGLLVMMIALSTLLCQPVWTVYSTVFLLCLFGLLVSVTALAYQTVEEVSNDICDNYPKVTEQLFLRAETELGCNPSQTTGFRSMVSVVESLESGFITGIYQNLTTRDQGFDCPGWASQNQTWAAVGAALRTNSICAPKGTVTSGDLGTCSQAPGGCTVEKCATLCLVGSMVQALSQQAVQTYTDVTLPLAQLDAQVSRWGECQVIDAYLKRARTHLCDDIEPYTDKIWISVTFLMLCMVITTLVLLVSAGERKANSTSTYRGLDDPEIYDAPGATQLRTYGTA